MIHRRTLAVDFDGTIVDHKFPEIGELKDGVIEALKKLHKKYEIVITSCRASRLFNRPGSPNPALEEMIKFLDDNGVPYDRVDMGDEGKVVAEFYIDDRAVPFQDNWQKLGDTL